MSLRAIQRGAVIATASWFATVAIAAEQDEEQRVLDLGEMDLLERDADDAAEQHPTGKKNKNRKNKGQQKKKDAQQITMDLVMAEAMNKEEEAARQKAEQEARRLEKANEVEQKKKEEEEKREAERNKAGSWGADVVQQHNNSRAASKEAAPQNYQNRPWNNKARDQDYQKNHWVRGNNWGTRKPSGPYSDNHGASDSQHQVQDHHDKKQDEKNDWKNRANKSTLNTSINSTAAQMITPPWRSKRAEQNREDAKMIIGDSVLVEQAAEDVSTKDHSESSGRQTPTRDQAAAPVVDSAEPFRSILQRENNAPLQTGSSTRQRGEPYFDHTPHTPENYRTSEHQQRMINPAQLKFDPIGVQNDRFFGEGASSGASSGASLQAAADNRQLTPRPDPLHQQLVNLHQQLQASTACTNVQQQNQQQQPQQQPQVLPQAYWSREAVEAAQNGLPVMPRLMPVSEVIRQQQASGGTMMMQQPVMNGGQQLQQEQQQQQQVQAAQVMQQMPAAGTTVRLPDGTIAVAMTVPATAGAVMPAGVMPAGVMPAGVVPAGAVMLSPQQAAVMMQPPQQLHQQATPIAAVSAPVMGQPAAAVQPAAVMMSPQQMTPVGPVLDMGGVPMQMMKVPMQMVQPQQQQQMVQQMAMPEQQQQQMVAMPQQEPQDGNNFYYASASSSNAGSVNNLDQMISTHHVYNNQDNYEQQARGVYDAQSTENAFSAFAGAGAAQQLQQGAEAAQQQQIIAREPTFALMNNHGGQMMQQGVEEQDASNTSYTDNSPDKVVDPNADWFLTDSQASTNLWDQEQTPSCFYQQQEQERLTPNYNAWQSGSSYVIENTPDHGEVEREEPVRRVKSSKNKTVVDKSSDAIPTSGFAAAAQQLLVEQQQQEHKPKLGPNGEQLTDAKKNLIFEDEDGVYYFSRTTGQKKYYSVSKQAGGVQAKMQSSTPLSKPSASRSWEEQAVAEMMQSSQSTPSSMKATSAPFVPNGDFRLPENHDPTFYEREEQLIAMTEERVDQPHHYDQQQEHSAFFGHMNAANWDSTPLGGAQEAWANSNQGIDSSPVQSYSTPTAGPSSSAGIVVSPMQSSTLAPVPAVNSQNIVLPGRRQPAPLNDMNSPAATTSHATSSPGVVMNLPVFNGGVMSPAGVMQVPANVVHALFQNYQQNGYTEQPMNNMVF